jgi:adenylate cyclase
MERQMVGSWQDWNEMQLGFIKKHQYFTNTAQNLREVNKQQQIERLHQLISKKEVDNNMDK